jgi:hypothetical protein
MESLIILALTTLASAFVGSYLGGYLKRKGENLATHEDIDKLTDQVAAVTKTAKEIEAKISSDMWNRQKRWELKREVLFDSAKRITEVEDALHTLDSVLQVEIDRQHVIDADLEQQWAKNRLRFLNAATALDETRLLVAIVCAKQTKEAFDAFGVHVKEIAGELSKKKNVYLSSREERSNKRIVLRTAIRKELGIDALDEPPPVESA